jgi:hypothetical protein
VSATVAALFVAGGGLVAGGLFAGGLFAGGELEGPVFEVALGPEPGDAGFGT